MDKFLTIFTIATIISFIILFYLTMKACQNLALVL
jgi:hypothetical protein